MQKQVDYAKAVKRKYPEQVVIAIAKDRNGKANPITLGWTMIASHEPPMMALFFGSRSGREVDKFAEFECATAPAAEIDSVLLSDAAANFECTLESHMIAGDHVIYVGNVVAAHVNTESLGRLYTVGPGHKLGGFDAK